MRQKFGEYHLRMSDSAGNELGVQGLQQSVLVRIRHLASQVVSTASVKVRVRVSVSTERKIVGDRKAWRMEI